jgi:hypothetical protein
MGDDETTSVEIINTMEAQEKAQAMLTKARSRKKREMHMEKERHQQMINIEGDTIMSAKGGMIMWNKVLEDPPLPVLL